MTIKELKEYLSSIVENLEDNYNEDDKVETTTNTYFLRGGYRYICMGQKGFIDLDYPTGEDEDEEN